MVRGIRPAILGRTIANVRKCRCRCKPLQILPTFSRLSRLSKGQSIVDVRRFAKRIVLEYSSGDYCVIEPRMTGLMLLADPPDVEHLRIEWNLSVDDEQTSLWFWDRRGLGTITLWHRDEFETTFYNGRFGTDALAMSVDEWSERCATTSREIKVAMLDQTFIAGIGNLYASEILHVAKIHPQTPANRLSRQRIIRLQQATLDVLHLAIRYEGSTLEDGTYRNALNQSGQFQNQHRVYARAGEKCPTCERSIIQRIVQAQRSTFFCRRCQALR